MRQRIKKLCLITCVLSMMLSMFTNIPNVMAKDVLEYEIYPTPQHTTYQEGEFILRDSVNVVYESTIDEYTKDRLLETTNLKELTVVEGTQLETNGKVTNILVGTYGSNEYIDEYVSENYDIDYSLFEELDSYLLIVDNGNIIVLGKDSDAAFYGLTSLYHVFNQLESKTILNFTIEDYADVASRGFIEGYYGNPWSVEDRVNLMTWSGYYKLNSYFYAPKDDPKHNSNWRELYTEEELEELIVPLAEAGNASKCRYVYALHPYMSNAISYASEEAYQADLAIVKAKFTQVIECGVRQIAILADDAGSVGGDNYIRTLEDITEWIVEMQEIYPDLKIELPFCTVEYGGYGESYYSQFPENVQIIMTGGKVWGEVSQNYTDSFTNNVGRGPYLWINWPCTDNSKNHLIMAGYADFLQPGVSPEKIEGIVLNPMQQSEPSKVAIFGNACYSWNIWQSESEAEEAWYDSFKHVNQTSAIESEVSEAFRELSKHMINQNMDSRVLVLEESVDLKEALQSLETMMDADALSVNTIDELIEEFELLATSSVIYREQGDEAMVSQIVYWLDCWDDTAASAIAYLTALKAYITGDSDTMINEYTKGQTNFAASKTHDFWYLDHYQYAEVGVQHIVPFIKAMDTFIGTKIKLIADPNIIIEKFITNVFTSASIGSEENITDKDDSTYAQYYSPNYVQEGDYIGLEFNNPTSIDSVRVLMGAGKNHIQYSKIEYTTDGETWREVSGVEHIRNQDDGDVIVETNLGLTNVLKIRIVASRDNTFDSWVQFYTFEVNTHENNDSNTENLTISASYSSDLASAQNSAETILDGNKDSELWLKSTDGDYIPANAYVTLDLGKVTSIESVYVAQGLSASSDILVNADILYSSDGTTWNTYSALAAQTEQTITKLVDARYIRIMNNEYLAKWWRLGEVSVTAYRENNESIENVFTNIDQNVYSTPLEEGGAALVNGTFTLDGGEYIGISFANNKELNKIALEYTTLNDNLELQVSKNNYIWENVSVGTCSDIDAKYIRLYNSSYDSVTISLEKFEVHTNEVYDKHLEDSNVEIIASWGTDTRDNGAAFDGVMGESTKFSGNPYKDQYIIYDLGQELDINQLRIYTGDSHQDYIRDAVVQVSSDMQTWNDLFTIGDGVKDESAENYARETFTNYDSNYPNYLYAGSDELDHTGRYLRILFTADFPSRAVIINEIIINNGQYLGIDNNRDYMGALEVEGFVPSNMNDGDLSTAYKGSITNSSMKYIVSNPEEITSIRIIQSGANTNAKVTATVFNSGIARSSTSTITLGTLNQTINEFNIPSDSVLLDVSIEWEEDIPTISEIITMNTSVEKVDKAELEELLKTTVNEGWTQDSKDAFESVKDTAQAVFDNEYVSQSVVNSAKAALQKAIDEAIVKGDTSTLEVIVKDIISNEDGYYTTSSYSAYLKAISNANTLIENSGNVSANEISDVIEAITTAKENLTYVILYRELAQLAIMDTLVIVEETYTKVTYVAYQNAKQILEDAITKDKAATTQEERVTPKEMQSFILSYEISVQELANISVLETVLDEFNTYDSSLYTESSYEAYKQAITDLEALKETGTIASIDAQLVIVEEMKQALQLKTVSLETLTALIKECESLSEEHYTKLSYKELQEVLTVSKEAITNNEIVSDEQLSNYVNDINKVRNALVNVVALIELLEEINEFDSTKYTNKTFTALKEEALSALSLLEDGSTNEINEAMKQLDQYVLALTLSGTSELNEYMSSMQLLDKTLYTPSTYTIYLQAYSALVNSEDISLAQFIKYKTNYETSLETLVLNDADYSELEALLDKVPSNLSIYTSNSVSHLNKVIASIQFDKNILQQDEVDAYVKALNEAIELLEENKIQVDTFDATRNILYVSLCMLSMGIFIFLRRKQKNSV